MELLTTIEVEQIVEDKIYQLIKENVTVEISREYSPDVLPHQKVISVEIWYGSEKIDSDFVVV